MSTQLWVIILSSSFLGAALGALIAGVFGLWAKRNEYLNDYFKLVIKRRVEAYEKMEQFINKLRLTVQDYDNRPYHQVFSEAKDWQNIHNLLVEGTTHYFFEASGTNGISSTF